MARIRNPSAHRRFPTEQEKADARKRVDAVLKASASEAAKHAATIKEALKAIVRIDEKLQAVEGDRFLKTEWTLFGVDRSELKPMLAAFENMHARAVEEKEK